MQKYKLSKEEQKEIDDKLKELLELCQIYHTPMFATVAVENNEKETKYNNISFGASANRISLTDDQIRHHILITVGFSTVPRRDNISVIAEKRSVDLSKEE